MVEIRIRKKKIKPVKIFEPPEDKYGVIIAINDIKWPVWYTRFREYGETIYSKFNIWHAYEGMPAYIYLTSCKGIAADAKVGSDEDLKRIQEHVPILKEKIPTPLINLREIKDPIEKDELITLGIFKKPPQILKYITKTNYKTIESLFEDMPMD